VNIQFFETYTLNEISAQWLAACKLSAADTLAEQGEVPLDQIGFKGLRALLRYTETNGPLGFAQEKDIYKVDSILAIPEIAKLFPKDLEFMWSLNPENMGNAQRFYNLYAVKVPAGKKARVDGRHIVEAVPETDNRTGSILINIEMTKDGAYEWELMTQENINRCIAITMDKKVISCPIVVMAITEGKTQISGNFSMEEAGNLSDQINAGK
jgi:SecD/SecF fusion protein